LAIPDSVVLRVAKGMLVSETVQGKEMPDSGLFCIAVIARLNGIACDPGKIRHDLALSTGQVLGETDLLRSLKGLGFKAKVYRLDTLKLEELPVPAILQTDNGSFHILAKGNGEEWLVQAAGQPPEAISSEDLKSRYPRCILLSSRSGWLSATEKFGIRWFLKAIMRHKKQLIDVLLASVFVQLLALATPLFFQVVVDRVLSSNASATLNVLAVGFFFVIFFEAVIGFLRGYLTSHTANRIDVILSSSLFSHLVYLPIHYFKARRVGDTIARARELDSIRQFLTGSAMTLLLDVVFTLAFLGVITYYSVTLALVVMATIPLYFLMAWLITPVFKTKLDEKFKLSADNQAYMVETITGIETLKATATEPRFTKQWDEKFARFAHASFEVSHLSNLYSQATSFVSKLAILGILWFGAHEVMANALTIGGLIAVNILAGRISGPVLRMAQMWSEFQQVRVGIERVADILDVPDERATGQKMRLPALNGEIALEQVVFRYQPQRAPVINGLSLKISSGEVIGVVGRSGSGKSTLTRLIQRLYVPEQGRVMVDGVDLSLVDPSWLRQQVGVVLQENFLYNRSIRDNIALSDTGIPDQWIYQAAKLAGAHEFIVELPEGYDTILSEGGSTLSGGQRQRLAIARALVRNPRILIFDEATSALDYESEAIIQKHMPIIAKGRTVIVIAHRLSTVRNSNRIVVMDKGRIIECGSHEQLVERKGAYAHLLKLQEQMSEEAV